MTAIAKNTQMLLNKMDFPLRLLQQVSLNAVTDEQTRKIAKFLWGRCIPYTNANIITVEEFSYCVIWLDSKVDQEVAEYWKNSPIEGWLYSSVANTICMATLALIIPEIAIHKCAPVPKYSKKLSTELESLGLFFSDSTYGILGRQFAILTWYPFRGKCSVCALRLTCSK